MNSPIPKEPLIFTKPIGSLLVGAEATVQLPTQSNEVHHEVEWVVALDRGGKNIPKNEVWDYVAGWSVGIDLTARDLQSAAKKAGKPWAVSKGFDGFGPVSHSPQSLLHSIQSTWKTTNLNSLLMAKFDNRTNYPVCCSLYQN